MADTATPWQTLQAIRSQRPLVHNITNFVAMDLVANVLLAAGASPAMAHAAEEVEELAAKAAALTINIGTLSPAWIDGMVAAARAADAHGTPWVLDPVGAAGTRHRRDVARRLAAAGPAVIRGNGSEIMALVGEEARRATGVDSIVAADDALDAARALAGANACVVAVTGTVDYVSDGARTISVAGGHALMGRVSGLGCALTGLIGACCAVTPDRLAATAHGLAIMAAAGAAAGAAANGPGSFRMHLLDALYQMDEAALTAASQ